MIHVFPDDQLRLCAFVFQLFSKERNSRVKYLIRAGRQGNGRKASVIPVQGTGPGIAGIRAVTLSAGL